MADTRRTYIDPTGSEILFYSMNPLDGGWYPDLDFLEDWRLQPADIWAYRPVDRPDLFITVPNGLVWPLMTVDEAANIRAWPEKPWILGATVIDHYSLDQIMCGEDDDALMELALAASASASTNSTPPLPPLPPHVVAALLRCAEAEGLTCSITLDPLTVATGAVTGCGHYFQKAALERWLAEHGTCPECRAHQKT
jgi:hypothetical protein